MTKILLNNYKMNEAIVMLKNATQQNERQNFIIKCDNCTLDIVAGGMLEKGDEVIEIALFTEDGIAWHSLDFENADGSIFTLDTPIIHNFPLICFPAFVRQFKSLSDDDMSEVWDACDTISCYM